MGSSKLRPLDFLAKLECKMLMFSRILISSLLVYQVLGTTLELDPWGEVTYSITEETIPQIFTCSPDSDSEEEIGTFKWFLDGVEVKPAAEETVSTYEFVGDLQDDNKDLKCQYTPKNGGDMSEASVTLKIQKHILPKSPFVLKSSSEVGTPVSINLDMELYPKPEGENVVWVIEDPQQVEEKIELLPGASNGRYSAGDLTNLEDNKYTSTLEIDSLTEEDVKKNIYFLLKANEDRRVDIEITMARVDWDTTPESITITTEKPGGDKRMGAGLWVIVVLVLLVILACIGYCIWQRWCRKSSSQEQDQEKGDFHQVPQNDTQQ